MVVDRVNVSVLLYVPVRSGSLAPISCVNVIVDTSLEAGAFHVVRGLGNGEFGLPQLVATDDDAFDHWLTSLRLMDFDQDGVDDVLVSHLTLVNTYTLRMMRSDP